MKRFWLPLIIAIALITFPGIFSEIFSQPPLPDGPGCWPPPCTVPLDGGITFLIAAGAIYGGKKLFDNKKKSLI